MSLKVLECPGILNKNLSGHHEYPGWFGCVSMLGTIPVGLSTINYRPAIPYHLITEYSTIRETLQIAELAG